MNYDFNHLLEKFLADNINAEELRQFLDTAKSDPALLATHFEERLARKEFKNGSGQHEREALFAAIMQKAHEADERPVIKMLSWKKWMVAASVIVLLGIGGYFLFMSEIKTSEPPDQAIVSADIKPPQSNNARVVLSDGRSVAIDSLTVVTDGAVQVRKDENGNIVTTTLVDGTKVWLNAGSSIKYFASNAGKERRVEISGEGYFEVAKNKDKPFIVKKGETSITVLGTHFNVNAYDDEESLKVTLLEGSVQVSTQSAIHNRQSAILKPGQQALIQPSAIQLVNPDLEVVMAWKNGEFQFGENSDIQSIMRQLTRWYDLEVEYKGVVKERFGGSISRSENVSIVLGLLERTGGVKFKMEGRKVIVMP